jgi:hypothetical protein
VPERSKTGSDGGVTDTLRTAIEGTLSAAVGPARAGSAAFTERATQLLDEVARRGRDAQRRLSDLEAALRRGSKPKAED